MTETTTTYAPGDLVWIKKYGAEYAAKVVATGTRTVTVEFTTKGGRTKTYKVPGYDVAYHLSRRS